jgi:hypothetical protein
MGTGVALGLWAPIRPLPREETPDRRPFGAQFGKVKDQFRQTPGAGTHQ